MTSSSISFLMICKDNFDEVVSTFNSIIVQLKSFDEIVVVDSSRSENIKDYIIGNAAKSTSITYHYTPPNGVYDAQNYCISLAKNDWICFINSGDILLEPGRSIFHDVMSLQRGFSVYIFGQYFTYRGSKNFSSFIPNKSGLWPHQSIVYKKQLHDVYGEYDISFRYSADQVFFAKVRRYENFLISNKFTSLFYTDGLSSGFSLQYSKELWCVYRILQYGIIKSLLFSFVLPFFKILLKPILPKQSIQYIQESITPLRS